MHRQVMLDHYVVVLNMEREDSKVARFITAYVADTEEHIKILKTNKLIYVSE